MFRFLTLLSIFIFSISCFSVNSERTFTMIKPHAVENKDSRDIIKMIKGKEFRIIKEKKIIMTKGKFNALYGIHKNKPFFKDLKKSMIGKKVIVMILEKENAVEKYREFIGDTNPKLAKKGTIRAKFGVDKTRNAVHSSDSKENAEKEISIFFPQ